MHISSEQVLIVGMFLVYPVLAILLVLGKAVKHRPFLRLSRHMRSNVSEKMLSDEVLRMVDLLETAYNGYDIHVSKMLYRWQLKSEELGLFKPCEARQEFARLFLKLFYARIFADRIGQTRIVSKILYRTYALANLAVFISTQVISMTFFDFPYLLLTQGGNLVAGWAFATAFGRVCVCSQVTELNFLVTSGLQPM